MIKRKHIIAKGKVQGVFYRAFTKEKAILLEIKGFVRNLSTCDVEIVAEGENSKLQQLIEYLKQGPPLASVWSLDVTDEECTDEFEDFAVRY